MRIVRFTAAVVVGALLSACNGGGGSAVPSSASAPTTTSDSSQQSLTSLSVASRPVIPEYQPTPNPNEQLLILVNGGSTEPNGQALYTSTIQRYALSSGAPLSPINLQQSTCGGGGATQMVATAGDQYFLSYELNSNCQWQVEVDGIDGSVSFLNPKSEGSASQNLLTSSDLSTVLATAYQTTTVYRAPFKGASRYSTLYGAGTNSNGSVVFEPGTNGEQMTLAIESLVTGQTNTVSWSRGTGGLSPYGAAVYDARHAWVYFLTSNGPTYRLTFVDAGHAKYLGYITLPGQALDTGALTIDPTNSDIYVLINNHQVEKTYVYNVGACGCVQPRRVLTMPSDTQGITMDRNGQHLVAWYPFTQPTANIYDINPQTGTVERTYTVSSSSSVYRTVITVLAQ